MSKEKKKTLSDKLKMHSPDLVQANIAKLLELFPCCRTEDRDAEGNPVVKVDFDLLRQELSTEIVEGQRERYQLNWPGKRQALLTANAPISKTLRPCRKESVDFDTTRNLFIEGDNLEALKLLQESYSGMVKMIYIDPPYNTGKDFIYKDRFAVDSQQFLLDSGQVDEEGGKLVPNPDSNGRFHSDWLSMMYSRLELAKNLLAKDGVIFISCDDNELANLTRLCDEVFGERNFVASITLLCNPKGRSQDKFFATNHEYLVVYGRQVLPKGSFSVEKDEEQIEAEYPEEDDGGKYRLLELRNTHREFGRHNRRNLFFPLYCNDDGGVSLTKQDGFRAVLPLWDDGYEGCWTWDSNKAAKDIDLLVGRNINGTWKIFRKSYANGSERMLKTILMDKSYYTEKGQKTFNELFETRSRIFPSPKSPYFIKDIMKTCTGAEDIVLDFFSGSATTAHAVMQLNADDGANRRFILVQLPEPCEENSVASQAGFSSIAEIGKERIRRTGKKILKGEYHEGWNKDVGFRVLKIDSSNMENVYYTPGETNQKMLHALASNVKKGRKGEDLLFQVMLDWGVDLASPIIVDKKTWPKKIVYYLDETEEATLAACFNDDIDEKFIEELAKRKPRRVVFQESGFATDAVKINAKDLFRLLSPGTEFKTI